MTTKIRPSRGGRGWEYDILFRWPEGGRFRERANAPVTSKSAAVRWVAAREAALLAAGKAAWVASKAPPVPDEPALTLGEFWPRVVRDHYRANRKKPSTIDAAESLFRLHIDPLLGTRALAAVTNADVAALKGRLAAMSAKSVNNTLSILSRCLRCAVEWGVLDTMPCRVALLPGTTPRFRWYEVHDYRRLVDAAAKVGARVHLLVLLGGSAGLRRGEIIALKWTDLDMARRMIHLERAMWRKHEETPKGGRGRSIPMTPELAAALAKHRHLQGERVLYSERGEELSNRTIRNWMAQAQRRAGLDDTGAVHVLRHTFCSHLAAAGVPAKAIQELAGHADLATTLRYMHLSPSDRSSAMTALTSYHAAAPPLLHDIGGTGGKLEDSRGDAQRRNAGNLRIAE